VLKIQCYKFTEQSSPDRVFFSFILHGKWPILAEKKDVSSCIEPQTWHVLLVKNSYRKKEKNKKKGKKEEKNKLPARFGVAHSNC